jgi:hypothetical protein
MPGLDRQILPPPDKLTLWPVEGGRFGLDATFTGAFGLTYAEEHQAALRAGGLEASLRQDLGDTWTLRMGPLTAAAARTAVEAFLGL